MELQNFLNYSGGVARTQSLKRQGIPDRAIRLAVSAGTIRRLRHGVLAVPGAAPELVAAVLANGVLCCVSAAPFLDLWRLQAPERIHVLCKHGAAKGMVMHRGSVFPPESARPVASVADTLLHALRCQPPLEAAVMVESAVRQGRTTLEYHRQRLPGNRNGIARRTLDLVDGSADSAIEVVGRLLFRAAGIYTETQVELEGIGIVDFLLEGFLIVELDGSTHLHPKQVIKDRLRNNASALAGYAVLRYGYKEIMFQRDRVLAEVWQVLRGRVIR